MGRMPYGTRWSPVANDSPRRHVVAPFQGELATDHEEFTTKTG